jgi:hypothetical protein
MSAACWSSSEFAALDVTVEVAGVDLFSLEWDVLSILFLAGY